MTEQDQSQHEVVGRVKWFDPAKGFGFVVVDNDGGDILLHANVLRNFGQSFCGRQCTHYGCGAAYLARGPGRRGAGDSSPEDEDVSPIQDLGETDAAAIAALPLEPGGAGQMVRQDQGVWVRQRLRAAGGCVHPYRGAAPVGFADLQPGEAVCLRVIEGKRGRMAAQVVSWEAALRDKK